MYICYLKCLLLATIFTVLSIQLTVAYRRFHFNPSWHGPLQDNHNSYGNGWSHSYSLQQSPPPPPRSPTLASSKHFQWWPNTDSRYSIHYFHSGPYQKHVDHLHKRGYGWKVKEKHTDKMYKHGGHKKRTKKIHTFKNKHKDHKHGGKVKEYIQEKNEVYEKVSYGK